MNCGRGWGLATQPALHVDPSCPLRSVLFSWSVPSKCCTQLAKVSGSHCCYPHLPSLLWTSGKPEVMGYPLWGTGRSGSLGEPRCSLQRFVLQMAGTWGRRRPLCTIILGKRQFAKHTVPHDSASKACMCTWARVITPLIYACKELG